KVERAARLADAADAVDELAHDFRPLGIAEVQVVGDRKRPGTNGGEIAPALGHRLLAALERIGLAIARRHVGSEGEALRPLLDPDHGRVAAWPLHRVAADDVIVLLP